MSTVQGTQSIIDLTGQRADLQTWRNWAKFWEVGLDPGTGITTVCVQGVREVANGKQDRSPIFRRSFPSVVASGENLLASIGNVRNAPPDNPAAKLAVDEYILQIAGEINDDLVGPIAYSEGLNWTDAKGDPGRYWGTHIRRLALNGCSIIPDKNANIHLNLCMPLSLFSADNKKLVMENLDGVYAFAHNSIAHEFDLRVGTTIPEGVAAIIKYGNASGKNLALDIGDRTMEVILANGLAVTFRDSHPTEFGVRQLLDAVQKEIMTAHGRNLPISAVRDMVKFFSSKQPLPQLKVPKGTESGYLSNEQQRTIIAKKQVSMKKDLVGLIRQFISKDGAVAGGDIDTATIYGGGAYLFYEDLKRELLPDLYKPNEAEYLNAHYALETVQLHTELDPARWNRKR